MKSKRIVFGAVIAVLGLAVVFLGGGKCGCMTWTGTIMVTDVIKAPPETVFAYAWDRKYQDEFFSLKIVDWEGEDVGTTRRWKIDALGQTYEGQSTTVDYVHNQRDVVVFRLDNGDMAMKLTSIYRPDPQGTKVIWIAEYNYYKLPPPLALLSHQAVQQKLQEWNEENLRKFKDAVEKLPPAAESEKKPAEVEACSDSFFESVEIAAPPEKVWDYMFNKSCVPQGDKVICEWFPTWEMKDVEGQGAGMMYNWTYEVSGQKLHGAGLVTEWVPNQREVEKYSGDQSGTVTILFTPHEKGTKLIVIDEAAPNLPKGSKVSPKAFFEKGDREWDNALKIIKEKVEKK